MLAMVADGRGRVDSAIQEEELPDLREHGRTDHPLGNTTLVNRSEQAMGRVLHPKKRGRPPKLPKRP